MYKRIIRLLEQTFKPIFIPIKTRAYRPIRRATRIPIFLMKKFQQRVRRILFPTEITLDHYFRLGRFYVAKRLVLFIFLLLIAGVYLVFINPPAAVNKFFNKPTVLHEKVEKKISFSGKAQVYDTENSFKYEGELVDGLYSGEGKLFHETGYLVYKGAFLEGRKEGEGELYNELGQISYRGQFAQDQLDGYGEFFTDQGTLLYKGEHRQGSKNGQGELYLQGQLLYKGEFVNDSYSGEGTLFYENGIVRYQGQFQNGKFGGQGTEYYSTGQMRYEGSFASGLYHGQGSLFNIHGNLLYEGTFVNGSYSGQGTSYYTNGHLKYEGNFTAGRYHDQGTLYYPNGLPKYTGQFIDGQYHGLGEMYLESGQLLYSGGFKQHAYEGLGTVYDSTTEKEVFKGFFTKGERDDSKFLGITAAQLKEILGEPSEIVVPTFNLPEPEPAGDENLTEEGVETAEVQSQVVPAAPLALDMHYNKYKLSFTLELSPLSGQGDEPIVVAVNDLSRIALLE